VLLSLTRRLRLHDAGGYACQPAGHITVVLNAAAHLVNSAWKFDHVTPRFRDLDYAPERISFRLPVLVYRDLHGQAPDRRTSPVTKQQVADVELRRRSSSTAALLVPATQHKTIKWRPRLFCRHATARASNCLSSFVTDAPSLPVFRRRLKTEVFTRSFGGQSSTWSISLYRGLYVV
jgi:hypothetical protein